jgi:hypothetical protein
MGQRYAGLTGVGSSIAYKQGRCNQSNEESRPRTCARDTRQRCGTRFCRANGHGVGRRRRGNGLIDRSLLKRACTPQDIADVIIFLVCRNVYDYWPDRRCRWRSHALGLTSPDLSFLKPKESVSDLLLIEAPRRAEAISVFFTRILTAVRDADGLLT